MAGNFALISPRITANAIRKDRRTDTCDMQAWYYQTETNTFAFARLHGSHGVRENIPADRTYFIASGKGTFIINGREHAVSKGSVICITKGATYDFRSEPDAPIEFFVDIGYMLDIATIPST